MRISWVACGRGVAYRWLWVLLIVTTGAACGAAASGTPGPSATAIGEPSTTLPSADPTSPQPSAPPSAPLTDQPTDQPMPADPPQAMLAGSWDAPAAGSLGTFTWDGLVSDAPWIVGTATGDVSSGPMTVAFVPAIAQATWLARWASVVDGAATDAVRGGDGTTGAIVISPPASPGDWSLQLTATFASGYDATWYWRLEIVR